MLSTNSDGGSRGNPGPGAVGILIRDGEKILSKHGEKIGECTNNIAEYKALIKALEIALTYTKKEIHCYLDSELIVRQLLGKYQVKNEKLRELFLKVQKLQEKFEKIKYIHVSRWNTFQKLADEIVNKELDKK